MGKQIQCVVSILIGIGIIFGGVVSAYALDIQQISIQGNIFIPTTTILATVESKVGLPYNPNVVKEDIQRIYNIGFFSGVEVDAQEVANGVYLTFIVEEQPFISQIEFQGNERVKDETLQQVLTLKPETLSDALNQKFSPQKVLEDREKLLRLYHEKGYRNAKITTTLVPDPAAPQENVILQYQIEENKKTVVRNVSFEGNTLFSEKELQKIMSVRKKGMFSFLTGSGKYMQEMLDADLETIKEFYRDHGYLDIEVVNVEQDFQEETQDLFITITLQEGDVYTIDDIQLTGNTIFSEEQLRAQMNTAPGDPFSPSKIRGDIFAIADLYAQQGYLRPISENTSGKLLIEPDIKVDAGERQVMVGYVIREGVPHTVQRINITGNKNTRDKVIRRELKIQEGDVFDSQALRRSQQRVFNLGLFENLEIAVNEGTEPHTIALGIDVDERYSIGAFNIGGGWDTVDNWTVTGGVTAENVFGLAHTLDLSATIGTTSTLFNIDYSIPRFLDSQYSVGLNAYNLRREYSAYDSKSSGGGVRFGRRVAENIVAFLKYRYEHVKITDVQEDASSRIKEAEGVSRTSSMSLLLRRSTINNVLKPTKGMRTELQGEVAGGLLGADNNFYKISLNNNIYFPLYKDIAFRIKGEYAYAEPYGDSEKVPIFERFFAGGATTIRGYRERSIGPDDENDEAIGGNTRIVLTSEIIIPLQKDIRFVTFFDVGDVYGADENIDFSTFRKGVGAGVRVSTPFGLLRFDWGYKLDHQDAYEDDEKDYEFHFGLGNVF